MTNKIFVSIILVLLMIFLVASFVHLGALINDTSNEIVDHSNDSDYLNGSYFFNRSGDFDFSDLNFSDFNYSDYYNDNNSIVEYDATEVVIIELNQSWHIIIPNETEQTVYYWDGISWVIDPNETFSQ